MGQLGAFILQQGQQLQKQQVIPLAQLLDGRRPLQLPLQLW